MTGERPLPASDELFDEDANQISGRLMCNARALSDCTLIIIEPMVDHSFHEIPEFRRVLTI